VFCVALSLLRYVVDPDSLSEAMRLLERADGNELRLTKDLPIDNIHRYAILSHTWGPDTDEVTYRDLMDGTGRDKVGYKKIQFCAEQAKRDRLEHFWVDTCCIDKLDPVEVQRSINSMFRWYRDATRCYVYLSDVSSRKRKRRTKQSETHWKPVFCVSRWFTRGWTLQELVAPASVEFFSRDGQRLGDKLSLAPIIYEITGIPIKALRDNRLSQFDIEERFRWAEKRETKYEEDWAYCLLGIFGVFMVPNYGEGKDYAIRRLRKEIDEVSERPENPLHPSIMIPFSRDEDFVERRALLNQISQNCARPGSRTALVGLGGVGYVFSVSAYKISIANCCEASLNSLSNTHTRSGYDCLKCGSSGFMQAMQPASSRVSEKSQPLLKSQGGRTQRPTCSSSCTTGCVTRGRDIGCLYWIILTTLAS